MELICLKHGFENTKFCQSPHALERIQDHCRAKNTCTMEVNAETLGRPVTENKESCVGTSLYLEIVYNCLMGESVCLSSAVIPSKPA